MKQPPPPPLPSSPQDKTPAEDQPARTKNKIAVANAHDVSRRSFIQTLGVSAAAGAINQQLNAVETANGESELRTLDLGGSNSAPVLGPGPIATTLNINRQNVELKIDPATTLLEALRHHLHLTGTKEICDRGACGGCSVHVDGKLISSCMMLAMDAVGKKITTIEGLTQNNRNNELDPVQVSFIRHDALQCGYCTPGFIMASKALLNENPKPTPDEIRKGLAGNFCRCGCHCNAVNAVLDASGQKPLVDGGDQA